MSAAKIDSRMPQVAMERIVGVSIPQGEEQIRQQQSVTVRVPKGVDIAEAVQITPHERVQHRTLEQMVGAPMPQDLHQLTDLLLERKSRDIPPGS